MFSKQWCQSHICQHRIQSPASYEGAENLEALIEKMNGTQSDTVTCVLADVYMASTMQVAKRLCIKRAAFLPASVAMLASTISVKKLVDDGIVDSNGESHVFSFLLVQIDDTPK